MGQPLKWTQIRYFSFYRITHNGTAIKVNPDKVFLFLLYYTQSFLLLWDSAEINTAVWLASALATRRRCQVCGKQSCIYRMPHITQTANVYSMSRFFLKWTHAYPHSADAIHKITNKVTNISDVQQNIWISGGVMLSYFPTAATISIHIMERGSTVIKFSLGRKGRSELVYMVEISLLQTLRKVQHPVLSKPVLVNHL